MKDFIQKYFKGDLIIWIIFLLLIAISAVEMYSASSILAFKGSDYNSPIWRHILFLGGGFCIAFIVHMIPYRLFPRAGALLLAFSLVLLGLTMIMGVSANEATRWLQIAGIQFQPSELAKLSVIIVLAVVIGREQQEKRSPDEAYKTSMIILAVTCIMIFPENFSTSFLLFLVGLLMMFYGRISLKKLGITLGAVVGLCLSLYLVASLLPEQNPAEQNRTVVQYNSSDRQEKKRLHRLSTWKKRVDQHFSENTKIDFENFQITDDNRQVTRAKIAIANSNGIGRGPGNSIERDFLSEAYSDFIYAIIIEETGLFGAFIVMLLYLILFFRVGVIANQSPSAFPALLVLGLASMIVAQAFMNMAVAVGLIPVTGQPLPMISRGGTAIIATSIYFGIILSVSRYVKEETEKQEVPAEETKTDTV